jgi:hypothetical protein
MTGDDVDPQLYTTVLRELIGQGLIANAYVGASGSGHRTLSIPWVRCSEQAETEPAESP